MIEQEKTCACTTDTSELSGDKCLQPVDQRNHYFTGKFFCKRDFQIEQDYFRSRNQLQNRLLHGWGIACGLDVEHHSDWKGQSQPDSDCARHYVVITSGVAVDPCGREVILHEPIVGRIPMPCKPGSHGHESKHGDKSDYGDDEDSHCRQDDFITDVDCLVPRHEQDCDDRGRYLLCLEYCEQKIEATISYCDDSGSKEYNRILERPRVVLLNSRDTEKMIAQGWWPDRDKGQHAAISSGRGGCVNSCDFGPCDLLNDGPKDDEHECCHDMPAYVPLALIKLPDPQDPDCDKDVKGDVPSDHPQPHFRIDTCGRTYVGLADEARLTEIVSVNWRHGGTYKSLAEFVDETCGVLTIRFNNPIIEDGLRFGPNWGSFLVQFDPETDRLEFADGKIELSEDHRCVHFKLAQHHLPGKPDGAEQKEDYGRHTYRSSKASDELHHCYVFISLKCDFILDCNGHAVDGNHIAGAVPCIKQVDAGKHQRWDEQDQQYCDCDPDFLPRSGNGSPGGTFESWFRIR